ncbi:hypothetical protein Tco_0072467 [Tanacetum coccineum]
MESLHISFQRVVDVGMFTGIKLSSSLNISHLFYADDAIFLGQWNDSNIDTLVHVMECFYRVSGLRINLCKSKIMGIHVDADRIKSAASKLGCLVLNTPFLYLGTKVGENMSRVHAWKKVIVKSKSLLLELEVKNVNYWRKLQNQGVNIFDYIRIKIGNGDNTSFWKDKWHNEGVLKDVFPRLYALERHQNVTIHTKLIDYSLVNSFRRNPRSGVEEFQLDNLSRLVSTITLSSAVDRYVWSLENSGEFSMKSIRQVIDVNCFPVIHSATRWVKSVPLKVNIMAWKIKMDGLPTRMNISRRDSRLGKYRLGGMWITLMFLLMRNGTLGDDRELSLVHENVQPDGFEMLSLYIRCSTTLDVQRMSRNAIVVHEMFNGGVEMISLYVRCSTDESRCYRCT